MNHTDNLKKAEKGAWLSICTYLFLAVIKLTIANWGNSVALWSDGINNTTDVIASIAVLIGLKVSQKPADENHRYGHFRAETIASLIAAFIMMLIGIQLLAETIRTITDFEQIEPNMLTAWTALGSALIMFAVYLYNYKLASRVKSSALFAAALDNRSDALVSIGAFIGIIGANLGVYWLDPLAGMLVALIICKTAFDIFKDASLQLTDAFDEAELEETKRSIAAVPQVRKILDAKGRIHGSQALIEITILLDAHLTVEESHQITEQIENFLYEKHSITHAHIHIEPYYPNENEIRTLHRNQKNS